MINDKELIGRYLRGDKGAFELLVNEYQERIYNFCLRMVKNPDDAADLTQEIFILVLRKVDGFRGDSKFSTWLFAIACNTCKDFLRRRKSQISISDSLHQKGETSLKNDHLSVQNDPLSVVVNKELAQAIMQGIGELPADYRMLVLLHDLQGFHYQEIADLLNISMGTVKSRLSRARLKLGRKLSKLQGTNIAMETSNRKENGKARSLKDGGQL
jgi:RNA polymerase sigma-70 factor (ECF subfamily)